MPEYLHTRQQIKEQLLDRPWMSTPNLRLAVLAPKGWYEDAQGNVRDREALRWMTAASNAGLDGLRVDSMESMTLELRAFEPGAPMKAAAESILRNAGVRVIL